MDSNNGENVALLHITIISIIWINRKMWGILYYVKNVLIFEFDCVVKGELWKVFLKKILTITENFYRDLVHEADKEGLLATIISIACIMKCERRCKLRG